jgi:hypothetical protein
MAVGRLVLGVVCTFTAGGLLFVQPPVTGPHGSHDRYQLRSQGEVPQVTVFDQSEVVAPTMATSSASTSILIGVFLGLLVGLTGYAAPAEANARGVFEYLRPTATDGKLEDWDKNEVDNLKRMSADAKKQYKSVKAADDAAEAAAKALMKPNYDRVSTGGGNYKQYKMDLAYPIKTIPDRDDGTYDFGINAPKTKVKKGLGGRYSALQPISNGVDEEEKAAVQKSMAAMITKPTKYGNFYGSARFPSPYPYKEQPRFREKVFGEYGQKVADALNAQEAAAKKN